MNILYSQSLIYLKITVNLLPERLPSFIGLDTYLGRGEEGRGGRRGDGRGGEGRGGVGRGGEGRGGEGGEGRGGEGRGGEGESFNSSPNTHH